MLWKRKIIQTHREEKYKEKKGSESKKELGRNKKREGDEKAQEKQGRRKKGGESIEGTMVQRRKQPTRLRMQENF